MKQFAKTLQIIAVSSGLLAAAPVWAHGGTGLAGGFSSGFAHPVSGTDHMLAMVSVGLWGAFLGRPLLYLLPVMFPMVMVIGAVLGMAGFPMFPVEPGIALSLLVLGGCIAFAVRAPLIVAATIVGLFAIFHGYAHGRELPSALDPVGYSLGFVLSTGLLHVAGIAMGWIKDHPGGEIAVRATGGLIGTAGIFLVASLATR